MKAMKAGARAMTQGELTKKIAESTQLKTKDVKAMVCSAANTPFTSFVLSCVDSAIFLVRSPWVIARAPAFIAFMATIVKAEGLEVTLLEGWGELEPRRTH